MPRKRNREDEDAEAHGEEETCFTVEGLYKTICQEKRTLQQRIDQTKQDIDGEAAAQPNSEKHRSLQQEKEMLDQQMTRLVQEEGRLISSLIAARSEEEKRKTLQEEQKAEEQKRKTMQEAEEQKRKTLQEAEEQKRKTILAEKGNLELVHKIEQLRGGMRFAGVDWEAMDVNACDIGFREGNNIFCLHRSLLLRYLNQGTGSCVLYCRPDFKKQWQFLEEAVCKEGCLGYILGPPGTGKTTTTLAFLHSLDVKEWSVMCIRLWGLRQAQILQVVDGKGRTCQVDLITDSITRTKSVLQDWPGNGRKFLFLDGFLHTSDHHQMIKGACCDWRDLDRDHRRLLVTTSLGSRGKTKPEEEAKDKARELVVYSWTLEEYREAIGYDVLYSSVADLLNDETTSEREACVESREACVESREALVESRYPVVGGSCRYMFEFAMEDAIRDFKVGMQSISNYEEYLKHQIGERSDTFVNRLFGRYLVEEEEVWAPISKFVATELASKIGESFVCNVMSAFPNNPVAQGFAFEMLFFARISRGQRGVVVIDRNKEEHEWGKFIVKDLELRKRHEWSSNTKICLKPKAWNQGGYDAVLVVKENQKQLVRFVQLTKSVHHDLKLRYFLQCLQALGIHGGDGWTVEIVFIVDKEILADFKVGQVEQPGALSGYGWRKGREKDQVMVMGMDARPAA